MPHDAADRTTPLGARWQALAVAAATRRGTIACGAPTHLVSLVRHGSGTTIGHGAAGEQRSALRAASRLLTVCDLTGTVMASGARPTRRGIARAIHAGGGDSLMIGQSAPTA
jgi:hypothetical protein